ncbi:hypothetical protein ACWH5J_12295, partial [Streptococcus gallolyticus]
TKSVLIFQSLQKKIEMNQGSSFFIFKGFVVVEVFKIKKVKVLQVVSLSFKQIVIKYNSELLIVRKECHLRRD